MARLPEFAVALLLCDWLGLGPDFAQRSPLWKASTTPDVDLGHFEANGYANAWEIPAGPALVLDVAYAPNRAFLPLVALSILAVGVGARSRLRAAVARGRCVGTALRRYERARARARSR